VWRGDLFSYCVMQLKNYALTFVTLGAWTFFGYADRSYYRYLDQHLRLKLKVRVSSIGANPSPPIGQP
jgi:hypothetical protein